MQALTSPHCSQNPKRGWGCGGYSGRLNCIPRGKMSRGQRWALGAPNPPFSPPRPRGSQQQRAAAAGALAPPPPWHPRPGAGSSHPACVRAQPRRGHKPPCPPRGTLVPGRCGHRHLHPSAVTGLIFERKDGNLASSCLAPLCREGPRATSCRGSPSSTFPSSSPDGDRLGSPPAPSHLTPPGSSPPASGAGGMGSPHKGGPEMWLRGTTRGGCPGVWAEEECWH